MATHYGLDGPGIESLWGRDFSRPSRPDLGSTQPPVECFPGLKWPRRDGDLPPYPPPRLKKEYRYTSTPPLCFFCSTVKFICVSLLVSTAVCVLWHWQKQQKWPEWPTTSYLQINVQQLHKILQKSGSRLKILGATVQNSCPGLRRCRWF